eukprot:m.140206 g.140206  ORF g.140206 m.140206 type:complete len:929 (-) comp20332_c1_seq2:56-2842(-)
MEDSSATNATASDAAKYLYSADEYDDPQSDPAAVSLPMGPVPVGFSENEVVATGEGARRSTVLYGSSARKRELGKQLLMSNGKRIDYVLVAELPAEESDRALMEEKIKKPAEAEEEKFVKNARKRIYFEAELIKHGVLVEKELARDNKTLYYKLHAPFYVLQEEAETVKMRLALNEAENKERKEMMSISDKFQSFFKWDGIRERFKWLNIFDSGIEPDPDFFSGVFRRDRKEEFQHYNDEEKFFNDSQRALLVFHLLNSMKYAKKDDQIGIKKLLNNKSFTDCFPLHDGEYNPDANINLGKRAQLYRSWGRFWVFFKSQPHDLIRGYFGEKVAIYFVWLGFYTMALIFPSFIGLLIFIYGLGTFEDQPDAKQLCESNLTMCPLCDSCEKWNLSASCTAYKFSWVFDNGGTIAFAFIMSLWASVFLDMWKRRNAELAFDWDVRDFAEEEPDRPQFKSKEIRPNPITGLPEKYYPARLRYAKYFTTVATVVFMLGLVIMVVISIILYRLAVRVALFKSSDDPESTARKSAGIVSAITASILNLIMILLLNRIYGSLAVRLTDYENHRKESAYESHLAFKIFLFQFVNSYSSLFYIAFFKGQNTGRPGDYNTFFGFRQDECPEYGCLLELTIQLSIIMVGKQTINNIQEVVIPLVKGWMAKRKAAKGEVKSEMLMPWEEEFLELQPYPVLGMFHEYLEMIIQYGFITLFVASFSLGPLFALGNNILEIRVDADKLCTVYRRPPPARAANIGVWQSILEFVSFFSVITNGLVIAVSSSYITKLVYADLHGGSLDGYISATHPLSPPSVTDPNQSDCHYTSLRDAQGEKGLFFYEVWAARLGFLIVFEHVVFLTKALVQYIIPDVPHAIELKVKREAYLARSALEGTLDADGDGELDDKQGLKRQQQKELQQLHSRIEPQSFGSLMTSTEDDS